MRLITILILLLSINNRLFAQNDYEYYVPSKGRTDVKNNSYAYLDREARSLYANVEGGFKFTSVTTSNSMDGLVAGDNTNEAFWGANVGYNLDNKWAVEMGFLKNPVFFVQNIASGRGLPFRYKIGSVLNTIPLRFKYKVLTLDAVTKSASVYLSGGLLFGMNPKEKLIFANSFNALSGDFKNPDTLRLTSKSYLTPKSSLGFEFQTELRGKIAEGFFISLFGRYSLLPKGAVRSDLVYTENSQVKANATQLSKPSGISFGLSLTLDIARGYKYKSKIE